jgi:exonuclease III
MNIMCLNCRGCGRSEAVREFRNLVGLNLPRVLFLSETKMAARKAETELRQRLGYANAFGVSSAGLSGGMVLMWSNDVVVDLKTYSKYHIDVWVTEDGGRRQQ